MRIAEVMTSDVAVVRPRDSVRHAAQRMDELNVGSLPVCDGKRLVGVITDRDITVRVTAAGLDPEDTEVSNAMSQDVRWCWADDDVEEVSELMGEAQIRRVPVINADKQLVGMVSLGDLSTKHAPGAAETLEEVSTPSAPDRSGKGN
ncbi:CBS domain-containing protein [Inquilinus ginsengisoli]|uniref:CBS domain-containing protein n=1 Tax=Inquilinus ginsengisoli TaxID=363840 RepID=UPI003D2002B6